MFSQAFILICTMNTFNVSPSCAISLTNPEDYYDFVIVHEGCEISVDVNFENNNANVDNLGKVKNIIDHLTKYDQMNRVAIKDNFAGGEDDSALFYVEHLLSDLDGDTLKKLVNVNHPEPSPEIQLLNSLKIDRIGFYPDSEDYFVTYDYTIGSDYTNYLLVITTDAEGKVDFITTES